VIIALLHSIMWKGRAHIGGDDAVDGEKFKFISNMHSFVLEHVDQTHKRQRKSYVV